MNPSVCSAPLLSAAWNEATSTVSISLSVIEAVASSPAMESVSDSVPSTRVSSMMGMRASKDRTPLGMVSRPSLRINFLFFLGLFDLKEIFEPKSTSS